MLKPTAILLMRPFMTRNGFGKSAGSPCCQVRKAPQGQLDPSASKVGFGNRNHHFHKVFIIRPGSNGMPFMMVG